MTNDEKSAALRLREFSGFIIPYSAYVISSLVPLAAGMAMATLRGMPKFLLPLLLCALVATFSGCSLFHKGPPKPSAHIYEGDSPTLRFSNKPESAGGAVNPY